MSGLNDWLDLSDTQQLALLQEDLEERLAARRRRDAERALKFGQSSPFPFGPTGEARRFPQTASAPPSDAGGSKSLPDPERIACTR